ncbi:hypothetical protein D3C86_1829280 [compost metagenome]
MHMLDDDLGTLLIRQLIVRTQSGILVLNKILRVLYFSNIMVQRPRPYQQGVPSYFKNRRLGQVGYLQRMLKSTRGLKGQFPQQLIIGIGQLYQCHVRGYTKHLFKCINKRISQQRQQHTYNKRHKV